MQNFTIEEVKNFLKTLNYKLISKKYINVREKLILKDKLGYYYVISLDSLKSGSIPSKIEKRNPYTSQNIKLWLKLNKKSFELISDKYEDADQKLKWKCSKSSCGESFESTWASISQDGGCSYCRGFKVGKSNCLANKNPNLAKQWHPIKNGCLTSFDVTCGSNKKIWWKCENEHEWEARVDSRNSGSGCRTCNNMKG